MLTGNFSTKAAPAPTTARKKRPTATTVQPDPAQSTAGGSLHPAGPTGSGPVSFNNVGVTGNLEDGLQKGPPKQNAATTTVDPNATGPSASTGGHAPAPNDSGAAYQPPPPSTDDLINQFVQGNLGAKADTTEAEKAFQDQENAKLGAHLYDQRASLGAAGFGASGMGVALENDARARAARDVASGLTDIRRQAEQDVYNRGLGAAGLDIQEKDAAQREADARARDQVIASLLGGDGAVTDPASGSPWVDTPTGAQAGSSPYDQTGDSNRNGIDDSIDKASSEYPGGADAFNAASQEGHTEAARYSVDNHGDFSKLPTQSPTSSSVIVAKDPKSGKKIYYDPSTKKLFLGA